MVSTVCRRARGAATALATSRWQVATAAALVAATVGPAPATASFGELSARTADCDPAASSALQCASSAHGLRLREDAFDLAFRSTWTIPEVPAGDALRRASYPVETSLGRVIPTVVYVPDPVARVPGLMSIALERAPAGDPLRLKAELGWSGRPGGSVEVGYRVAERQASFRAEERPSGVTVLPGGRQPGSTFEGAWTERLGPRASATVTIAGDRVEFDGRNPEVTSGRFDVRLRATDRWNVFAAMAGSSYADALNPELRRGVTAFGTELNAGPLILAAVVRDEATSSALPGRGGRVSLRASEGGWRASLYADVQQQAAVIELSGNAFDLPREVVDAGLVAVSPDALVPVLRDRGAVLAQHGIALGALRVDPLRVQGGLDVRWRDAVSRGTEFGLVLAMDDLQAASGARRGLLGQVQMSWRVLRETDLTASYANWSVQGDPVRDDSGSLFRLAIRSRL